jgi:small subunit ribosomal protein S17e
MIERFYGKMTSDFHFNKRVCDEVALIPSKKLRNKIAGYATRLMRRIHKGPVRGISLKLQEEEREKRMEYIPKETEFVAYPERYDNETVEMLEKLGLNNLIVAKSKQKK